MLISMKLLVADHEKTKWKTVAKNTKTTNFKISQWCKLFYWLLKQDKKESTNCGIKFLPEFSKSKTSSSDVFSHAFEFSEWLKVAIVFSQIMFQNNPQKKERSPPSSASIRGTSTRVNGWMVQTTQGLLYSHITPPHNASTHQPTGLNEKVLHFQFGHLKGWPMIIDHIHLIIMRNLTIDHPNAVRW